MNTVYMYGNKTSDTMHEHSGNKTSDTITSDTSGA